MINVPAEFRPHIKVNYPPNNNLIFEEWLYNNLQDQDVTGYLPIFWTSYYVNNNYGNDKLAINKLQNFIDNLDKSKKYWTVVQYDDGILNDVSGIDLKVFGMGGGHYDYPLPLTAQPHPYSFTVQRDIFCNFMGALTHPIRKELLPVAKKAGYLCSTSSLPIETYCMNLARSVFTLAPRGYGVTSFRLMEAVQYGSVPIYVSDVFMEPFNIDVNKYGVKISPSQIDQIPKILSLITPEELESKRQYGKFVYEKYFTYEGCKTELLKHI